MPRIGEGHRGQKNALAHPYIVDELAYLLLQIQMIIYTIHTLVGLIGILVSDLRHFLWKECGKKGFLTIQAMKEKADPLNPVKKNYRDPPRSDKRRGVLVRKLFPFHLKIFEKQKNPLPQLSPPAG